MISKASTSAAPEPEISEVTGPYIRLSLVGGGPGPETVEVLASLEPVATACDCNHVANYPVHADALSFPESPGGHRHGQASVARDCGWG
jgi:hypothetical protein